MNTSQHLARLAALAEEIYKLDAELIEAERDSLEVLGTEEECEAALNRVTVLKTALEKALRAHFLESTFLLAPQKSRAA